jgi:hypothetical protein
MLLGERDAYGSLHRLGQRTAGSGVPALGEDSLVKRWVKHVLRTWAAALENGRSTYNSFSKQPGRMKAVSTISRL